MANPFSLTFGKQPQNLISRNQQIDEVVNCFTAEVPENQVYMLTGVRGVGKTVFMTTVADVLRDRENWLVVDLNPERNLIDSLTAELREHQGFLGYLKDAQISLSAFGLGVELGKSGAAIDNAIVLDRILSKLTDGKKRVLVTVDEVTAGKNVREFVSQFQIYLRRNYNVFLLMTGLYENIYDLQNSKTMTFLYRAPKVELGPLNVLLIEICYKEIFGLTDVEAHGMAVLTGGYPYAFQLLGYLCYKHGKTYQDIVREFDAYLEEYVYAKIWQELSNEDKRVLCAMSKVREMKVGKIRELLHMQSGNFSVYRQRLLKKGLIAVTGYGYLSFVLPRFREFVLRSEWE